MVYYLPASERKMLKSSSPCPSASASPYPTASESEFPSFTDFLHSTE
jgi:hypothetical protein